MNVINSLVKKTLKLNKKRSIGTVIGIMLSVALVCAVSGMFSSLRATMIEGEKKFDGDYHFCYKNIDAETAETLMHNRDIDKLEMTGSLGYSIVGDYYVNINSMENMDSTVLPISLVDGRLPENSRELVLDEMALWELDMSIGDRVALEVGDLEISEDTDSLINAEIKNPVKHEYTIVGKVSCRNYFVGYTVDTETDKYDAYMSFKNPKKYKTAIKNILGHDLSEEEYSIDGSYVNSELLRWVNMEFSDDTTRMLYSVIGVLIGIILITSVFCIKNSFDISVTEKMKTYGMLASIGSTKKQIRKSVLLEGFYLGIIGIPLGILLGGFAVFVLCKIVSYFLLYLSTDELSMVCSVPLLPIMLSVLMGALTIYLSTILAAFKAGRVSPIENIRSNNEVKIKGKKLRAPRIISKLFGIGGVIAYKNLKRSKRKYRTTIISLAVSVFVFIAMSVFISEMNRQTAGIYKDIDYNVMVEAYRDEFSMPAAVKDKSDYILCSYNCGSSLQLADDGYMNYLEDDPESEYYLSSEEKNAYMSVYLMDDVTFERYLEKSGISAEGNKAVICDDYTYRSTESNRMKRARYTKYKKGDNVTGEVSIITMDETGNYHDDKKLKIDVTVAGISKERPYGAELLFYSNPIIVLNEKYYPELISRNVNYLIQADDAYEVADLIHDVEGVDNIDNLSEALKTNNAVLFLMGLFMYGFIIVISLIGVTNIFNTITSNMELRQKEFAMLKSIGMTKKEFSRMINLETIFYCCKALVYGIVSGLIAAELMHRGFNERIEDTFIFPGKAIAISIIFVFVLVYIIMKYSIKKINSQNTIETIRKDMV